MPEQFITKRANIDAIHDYPNASGVGIVNGDLYVHDGTAPRKLIDDADLGGSIARRDGVTMVTGVQTVVTGLSIVNAVQAMAQDNLDGDTFAGVSATKGDQAGNPAAGSIIIKCWKMTAGGPGGNPTMIAATAAKRVAWTVQGS